MSYIQHLSSQLLQLTLYRELSISAWPMFRLDGKVSCCWRRCSSLWFSRFIASVESRIVLFISCVGLSAPHSVKLIFASFHCSTKYGIADSRRLPIIWREINRPASCCRRKNKTKIVNLTKKKKQFWRTTIQNYYFIYLLKFLLIS